MRGGPSDSIENSSSASVRDPGGRFFQLRQNAVAHLRGRGLGKRDGNDPARLVDLAQQAQKAAREQIGFARARGRLDENGAGGIERVLALALIGRRRRGVMATHRRPPLRFLRLPVRGSSSRSCTRHSVYRPHRSQVFG